MRCWIVIALVAGCKKPVDNARARELPRPAGFETMSPDDRCTATAPRARPCHDELMKEQLRALGATADVLAKEPALNSPTTDREAVVLQRNQCAGSEGYTRAIVECWSEPTCEAFATCTITHAAKLDALADQQKHEPVGSDQPLDLDGSAASP